MPNTITRRQLGSGALGAAILPALTASSDGYGRALTGMDTKIDSHDFDPVYWTLDRYKSAPLQLTFRAKSKAEAEVWQGQLRTKLTELLGGFPERTPLQPQTLETRDFPGYRRERFVFESRPGVRVLGYLLTPKSAQSRCAAVVCIPGHGRGVDDIVGMDDT